MGGLFNRLPDVRLGLGHVVHTVVAGELLWKAEITASHGERSRGDQAEGLLTEIDVVAAEPAQLDVAARVPKRSALALTEGPHHLDKPTLVTHLGRDPGQEGGVVVARHDQRAC